MLVSLFKNKFFKPVVDKMGLGREKLWITLTGKVWIFKVFYI